MPLVGLLVLVLVVVPLLAGAAALLVGVAHLLARPAASSRPVPPAGRPVLARPALALVPTRA